MRKDIRYLTDEDGTSSIASRHSFPGRSRVVDERLEMWFEYTGAACRFTSFL
ncbi:hypothetical protein EDC04DRAFT_2790068 [Pisolithus marmoratus]|nr:hypothetical protein EDC04DRAFT_2790068 [Pisolithus marmoratus]